MLEFIAYLCCFIATTLILYQKLRHEITTIEVILRILLLIFLVIHVYSYRFYRKVLFLYVTVTKNN